MTFLGANPIQESKSAVIGVVIVARMNSSRLPGKSMTEFAGRSSLEWIVRRLSLSRYIEKFVFATTTNPSDDVIATLAARLGHRCFRGSEEDVLGRVTGAARSAGLDIVVHVTGDCPLVDARLADACIERYLAETADYVRLDLDAFPPGLDVEVFGMGALARVESSFSDPWIREHVTVPFYTMPERFAALTLAAPPELQRNHYRICVDTEEDRAVVSEIFANLVQVRELFSARDIVQLLDSRPDLVAMNAKNKETKYSCGVIGLGAVGSLYERQPFAAERVQTHARAYQRYGRTRLAAGCDIDPQRRKQFASDWKIEKVHATSAEMFADHKLDIVSIATPPETHGDLCLEAVAAGVRAILCEKPFVIDVSQGREVIQACRNRGVLLAVNFQRRWSRQYRALRDFVAEGGLGDVQVARLHYTKGAVNCGSHGVDLLRFLFGEVDSVIATESIRTDIGDDDIGGALRMESGLAVHLTVSDYRAHFCFELDVIGTRARVRMTDDNVQFWRAEPSSAEEDVNSLQPAAVPFDAEFGSPFEDAVGELVRCLDHGAGQPSCTGQDGLQALAVIRALQSSHREEGKRIKVGNS